MRLFVDTGKYHTDMSIGINICYEKNTKFEYLTYKEFYINISLLKIYFTIGIRTKERSDLIE